MTNFTDEDIHYMKTILEEMKDMCVKFEYNNEKTANFVYHVDSITRTLLEIINGSNETIERTI